MNIRETLEDWLRTLEHVRVGVAIFDERICYANDAFARAVGVASGPDLFDRLIDELLTPRSLGWVRASQEQGIVELELRHANGRTQPCGARLLTTRAFGRMCYVVVLDEPVHDDLRLRLEQKLERAERLASLATLLTGVGHEINNPLTYIVSNLSYIAENMPLAGPAAAELKAALDEAHDGAVRVSNIVKDLRVVARGSNTTLPVDLAALAQSSANLTRHNHTHTGANLHVELRARPMVAGAEGKLGQVILNLIINAFQATDHGASRMNDVTVVVDERQGCGVIEVRDTGTGIPSEHLPRIFEPFFSTKPEEQGSGLGLAISKAIIEEIGGTLRVHSVEGIGTEFVAYIPLISSEALAKKKKILIVDDEPFILRGLRRNLRAYDLCAAHDGRTALEYLRKPDAGFSVILCDIMMPDMSGIELYRRAVAQTPDIGSRFLFMTGAVNDREVRAFLEEGGHSFVEKPMTPDRLHSVITRRFL